MQELLDYIHTNIVLAILPVADQVPIHFIYMGGLLVAGGLVIGWMSFIAMAWIYGERRFAAFIQDRLGPNRVGPEGILQSLADGIKLLGKEDIIPLGSNRFLYELAPYLVFVGAFIPFVALPFSQHLVIADMDLGLFYIMAFGALEVVGILMAGWAPNSKWTLYGGMRLAAQMLSYEIPLGLSLLTVIILTGSLNLTDIVLWQTEGFLIWEGFGPGWYTTIFGFLSWSVFRSPAVFIGFFLFYICALAETKRAPFDLPEAESELVAGFHTEYTGMRFSFFFLAEYCAMYVMCALGAIVFLGGWHWPLPVQYDVGPSGVIAAVIESIGAVSYEGETLVAQAGIFLKTLFWTGPIATVQALFSGPSLKVIVNETFGFINLVGKAFILMFIMIWVRWTLPRVRIDQVIHICLKVLLPIGLALVVLAGVQAAFSPLSEERRTQPIRERATAAAVERRRQAREAAPPAIQADDASEADASAAPETTQESSAADEEH